MMIIVQFISIYYIVVSVISPFKNVIDYVMDYLYLHPWWFWERMRYA